MARDRMAPPGGGKGVAIVIGVPKGDSGKMPPPGQKDGWQGGKVSPEDAKLVLDSERCIDCTMYHSDTGECDKVDGTMAPQDGCYEYFDAIKGGEPDADDKGGPSDNDADDQQPGGHAA